MKIRSELLLSHNIIKSKVKNSAFSLIYKFFSALLCRPKNLV
uniref:Uncharacterized protein n=1 Tax=Siphoviridae sp. ctCCX1 TaxID=2823567 RepID=A0A8S5LDJ1_9CAUD|nr:MAG TPA: hypothetical protein [Siphoviridae sp. ctCCX1]